jgi:hypothetical protein
MQSPEYHVAGLVSIPVIGLFEMVEIEEKERDRPSVSKLAPLG